MARIYNRKGDRAVSSQITIPITSATREQLEQQAQSAGKSKTEYARMLLVTGLATGGVS